MSSTTKLNGVRLGRMIIAGANELASNKQLVDAMNVFPVPDGDTGTNMSLTVMAAAREAEKNGSLQVADIAKAASGGALRGARGNSGVRVFERCSHSKIRGGMVRAVMLRGTGD